jgi:hypothetical protein
VYLHDTGRVVLAVGFRSYLVVLGWSCAYLCVFK